MKNYYLVEKFWGPVSNVCNPIGVMTNKKKARKILNGSRGIITKIELNKVFEFIGKEKHWHVNEE